MDGVQMSDRIQILIAMSSYMAVIIGIGIYFAKRANKNPENYFIGGRSLGPWVSALSAEASDMSGWLLMGLPGVAYWIGVSEAACTAIGLALGTYLNWLIVAKRLRNYSHVANDSFTIPDFFSNRFREKKKAILTISALFILIFFTVYVGSCFVTCGKLFSNLFGMPYISMVILGAVFVLGYTFLGGFLAESVSDLLQAIVMIFALVTVFILGSYAAGGISNIFENVKNIPGFLDFFFSASPTVENGVQVVKDSAPVFGEAQRFGWITIVSTMAWGLGYFGVPQVLLRFMAIRDPQELKKSRRIATVWVLISLTAAVFIGLVGRNIYPTAFLSANEAESIFILISQKLLPPLAAGIVMAGILAATISSSDSYLLIAASAVAKNIYQGTIKKDADDKKVLFATRITLVIITIIGVLIALDEESIIFEIVSFAWAGFGATFGPLLLFSLFYKRTTYHGAIAGMLSGGLSVFTWKLGISKLGGVFAVYELLPSFIISCIFIFVVSQFTEKPGEEILDDFEKAKELSKA
jgi:sodium/proline symporter